MKTIISVFLALLLALPIATFAAKPGAQVGASQDRNHEVTGSSTRPNTIAGDGIPNNTQDEEYGSYGQGESPNVISGDGIPNNAQDESYGRYGGASTSVGSTMEDGAGVQVQAREQVRAMDPSLDGDQLRVQQRTQSGAEFGDALEQVRAQVREERTTDEGVRAQVRADREDAEVALRAMVVTGPMLGADESRMTQLATQLTANAESALATETRLRNRSSFVRFFTGGDTEGADELVAYATQNRDMLGTMQQLVEACTTCDQASRDFLQDQVRVMDKEQDRINNVATAERASRGLFGRLFGWMF
ncbi:MAG: hypothetical protein KBD24_01100 [Candidatus Pacebacteria bacterium]|nr:hypothetical protein [Candidatus Paceibacterota bacterium]